MVGCSDQPVAIYQGIWVDNSGANTGENVVNKYSKTFKGTNVSDYYRDTLNFKSSKIQLNLIATQSQTAGSIQIRLYDGADNLLKATTFTLNGAATQTDYMQLTALPTHVELEFNGYTGEVIVELLGVD